MSNSMQGSARRRIWLGSFDFALLLAGGCAFVCLLLLSTAPAKAEGEWCGGDAAQNWVCPLEGTVYAARRPLRLQLPVPLNNRRLVTAAASSARLSFEDRATCTLGELSEISPNGANANTIFTQRRGSASCWSRRASRVGIACGRTDRCPTELRADGSFLFTSFPPTGATASSVMTKRQRLEVVSCQGFVEVRVLAGGEVQRASGGGSPGGRLVIEIEVITKTIERRWGVVREEVAKVSSTKQFDVEECESSAVQEEEEIVRPRADHGLLRL